MRNALRLAWTLLCADGQAVIFWFAPMHETLLLVFVARLLQRKAAIITGGGDAIYVPEIDRGC